MTALIYKLEGKMDKFLQLKKQLNQLAILDATLEVFGAKSHEYKLNSCLSEAEIQAFENKHKITLPAEYRGFLLEVGNGGPGPGYGLASIVDNGEENTYQNLSQPFPWTQGWNNLDLSEDDYLNSQLVQGTLTIANYGCGIYALLVITGEQRGKVWIDDRTNDSGIYPASENFCRYFHDINPEDELPEQDDSQAMSFYDWYADWLNSSLEQLRQVA
jgi:hypothetical protein